MKKFGIIQPGRIGDIIILLPAMKKIFDQGYQIFWPIFEQYVWMFSDVINYVNFIPISNNIYTSIENSNHILKDIYKVDELVDTAATFPNSLATKDYIISGDGNGLIKFDEFKYNRLNIPFNKWNLSFIRNYDKEEEIYNKLVQNEKYALICTTCSQGKYNIQFDAQDGQIIEVTNDYNIFHWIKLIENAKTISVINSGFLCLVEQLNTKNNKIVFQLPNAKLPTLHNDWKII